jgi:hypothetical protein
MSVQIYLGVNEEGGPQEPTHSHEREGLRLICENLRQCFHHDPAITDLYALVANPFVEGISADAVLITNRGLGILELKHVFGSIKCSNPYGTWKANNHFPIKPNKLENKDQYANPHEQVKDYAYQVRARLMERKNQIWLPGDHFGWEELLFHTAVCFTHHDVNIRKAEKELHLDYKPGGALWEWERFRIIRPSHICNWASEIGFDADEGMAYGNRPYRWTNEEVERIASQFFKAVIWETMTKKMPREKAFAYLMLETPSYPTIFNIDKDEMIVGRGEDCDINIPETYRVWVSHKHARIIRTVEGYYIEDIGSSGGTFLNNEEIEGPTLLDPSKLITLGGIGEASCQLRFKFELPSTGPTGQPLTRT